MSAPDLVDLALSAAPAEAVEPVYDHGREADRDHDLPPEVLDSPKLAPLVRAEIDRQDGPRPGYLRGLAAVEARHGSRDAADALLALARALGQARR